MSETTDVEGLLADGVEHLQIDELWRTVGVCGKYQLIQITVLVLYTFTASIHSLSYYFLGYEPPHHCIAPSNSTDVEKYIKNVSMEGVIVGECSIRFHRGDNHSADPSIQIPCVFGNNYSLPRDTSILSELDLVCEKKSIGQAPEAAVMAGQLFGSLFSFAGDMFGRRIVQIIGQIATFVTAGSMVFVSDIWMICVLRFLTGVSMQVYPVVMINASQMWWKELHRLTIIIVTNFIMVQLSAIVPYTEMVPTNKRPMLTILHEVGFSSSIAIFGVVAYFLQSYSWRVLAVASSITAFPVILDIFLLDESLRWLIAKKKTKDAVKLLLKICKMNKVPVHNILHIANPCHGDVGRINCRQTDESSYLLPESTTPVSRKGTEQNLNGNVINNSPAMCSSSDGYLMNDKGMDNNGTQNKTSYLADLKEVIAEPTLILQLGIVCFIWLNDFFVNFSIILVPNMLSSDRYVNFLLAATTPIIGCPIAWIVMSRISRRTCSMIFHVMCGFGVLVSAIISSLKGNSATLSTLWTVIAILGPVSMAFCFNFLTVYTPEIFPTNLRNTGVGLAFFFGRIGGIAASFTLLLKNYYDWLPGVVMASGCFLVSILMYFLPETSDKEMPQTIAEVKAWKNKCNGQPQ